MVEAVLFDLDGTLIPLDAIFAATDETCRKFSIRIPHETIKREIVGRPFHEKLSILCSKAGLNDGAKAEAAEHYMEAFEKHYSRQKAFGFVRAVLSLLQKKGIKTAVVTTTEGRLVHAVLHKNGINPDAIVAAEHTKEAKPSPGPINLALSKLGKAAGSAMVVGDSTHDVLAAKAAGCLSAGVLTGVSSMRDLRKAGADYILANVSEVVEII